MRFSENRPVACVVLALAIAASLIFGGGGALRDQRNEIAAQFSAASESISAELEEMYANANTLMSIAKEYDDADAEYIGELEEALLALSGAQEVGEKYGASQRLSAAVEDMYSNLTGLELDDMDAEDARYKYKNFTSAQLRISHDGYNERASAFNQTLDRFPARILGALNGVKPLGLFR